MNNSTLYKESKRLKTLLEQYEYGVMPPLPKHLDAFDRTRDRYFAAGKAELVSVKLKCELENGESHAIAIRYAVPQKKGKYPTFIHIKSDVNMPDRHQPTEEICDGGFAVVSVGVGELITEFGKRKQGLVRALRGGNRGSDAPGSIAISAWCAMRAVDYLVNREDKRIDTTRLCVVGCDVYAAAALLTAAYDSRIAMAISNSAGAAGVADKTVVRGELFELKADRPDLFCRRFYKTTGKEEKIPFGGDSLLALIAPRPVLLDNAVGVLSNSARAELCSALSGSRYYEACGARGLSAPDDINPTTVLAGEDEVRFMDGDLAYRRRDGLRYISREDWRVYMDFAIRGGEK